ncbi:histidine kinase [Paenibacillus alkaliterrae]|uniref:sensor histidine kinase n=1 Tax=Paenibacillus alkaliterrae TaxID=320909 RepID=UPI001F226166|nr:histidine kinase [Paenibacillus alkaliterrae]MCF2939263.1 histidine kinase [Paenibacillus alkaliterrae]
MIMRLWRRKWFGSLRSKILSVFVLFILPLISLLIYYNFYSTEVIRNQVALSNKNLLSLYMGQIDRDLEAVDKYLFNLIALEPDLLVLELEEGSKSDMYNMARIRLFNKISRDVVFYGNAEMFFIYSDKNQDLIAAESYQMVFQEEDRLKTEIIAWFGREAPLFEQQWFIHKGDASPSLFRVIKYGNVYVGALFDIDKLMVPFEQINLGEEGKMIMLDRVYFPVNSDSSVDPKAYDFTPSASDYRMTGEDKAFMVVSESSEFGQFAIAALIPEKQILENIPYLRKIVFFLIVGTVIVMPIIYLFLRHVVLVPMKRVVSAMRKIKSGDWEARMDPNASSGEFAIINETFNNMVSQIKELKISVYEEQLINQKAELKHLQLQINPHFFLNSLNIMFHLSQAKNYELIQEMILSLVQYFRYMFRSHSSFVPIEDEIEHTRNYLNIQAMRFPKQLTYQIAMSESLRGSFVPPLVCQTFVENTIKHGVSMDGQMHISVDVREDDRDPAYMRIVIRDTGKGFEPFILQHLHNEMKLGEEQGNHIGIWNVRRRLRLLYPNEQTELRFENGEDGGAVVRIRLPSNQKAAAEVKGHV